jgi:hypothetical protein
LCLTAGSVRRNATIAAACDFVSSTKARTLIKAFAWSARSALVTEVTLYPLLEIGL